MKWWWPSRTSRCCDVWEVWWFTCQVFIIKNTHHSKFLHAQKAPFSFIFQSMCFVELITKHENKSLFYLKIILKISIYSNFTESVLLNAVVTYTLNLWKREEASLEVTDVRSITRLDHLTCFPGSRSDAACPPFGLWVQIQSFAKLIKPDTRKIRGFRGTLNQSKQRVLRIYSFVSRNAVSWNSFLKPLPVSDNNVSTLFKDLPLNKRLCGLLIWAGEQKPDTGQSFGEEKGGGEADCSHTLQIKMPHQWSPEEQITQTARRSWDHKQHWEWIYILKLIMVQFERMQRLSNHNTLIKNWLLFIISRRQSVNITGS